MALWDPALERVVQALLEGPARSVDELQEAVRGHLARVRAAAAGSAFVDVDTAERVARGCLGLLEGWSELDAGQRRWVQVACLYFADRDDGEHDFGLIGFDDDDDVLHHVLDRLGRTEG